VRNLNLSDLQFTFLCGLVVASLGMIIYGFGSGRFARAWKEAGQENQWRLETGLPSNDGHIVTLTDGTHHIVCYETNSAVSCVKVD